MGAAENMSGGYQVQAEAIQQAITHLQNLLDDAETNDQQMQLLSHIPAPGGAKETENFHNGLHGSLKDLVTNHSQFITSVQDQITKLQTTLQRYQSGEDAARYGFGN
jgi:prefoldin subunit 5